MRRLLGATITALLISAPAAAAATGASLTFNHHGAFTLHQARRVAVRQEAQFDVGAHVGRCHWQDRHDAACDVTASGLIFNGLPAAQMTWEDVVTRSGPCENAGRIVKRVHGLTYQDGGHHAGNCFTGPLLVLSRHLGVTLRLHV